MAGPGSSRKRKIEDMKGRPKKLVKKFKKQTDYDSGSGDDSEPEQDFKAVNLQDSDSDEVDTAVDALEAAQSDEEEEEDDEPALDGVGSESEVTDASGEDSESAEESDAESNPNFIKKRKRNDSDAFATSMAKILGSKLSTSKRSDPVLSRSATAIQASKEITDIALEKKAKNKLRDEKRTALDKGRVKDVLGASTAFDAAHADGVETTTTAETMELERRLRKTAQRGVVKLFNAVRAAQIKGEEAAKEARQKGVIGFGSREQKVNEMSKQGFLDLIAGGGAGVKTGGVEEA